MCCRACRRVRVCHTHFSIDCPTVHLCPILVQTVHCPHTHGFQFVNSSVKYVLASPPRVHDDVDLAWTTKVWRHALTNITTADVALVFSGAVLMTLVRYWLTWSVFEPWLQHVACPQRCRTRAHEQLFKAVYFVCAWVCVYIVVLVRRPHWWTVPGVHWQVQFSFYLHSIYATLVIEQRKKDFCLMMMHHAVALLLMTLSFATGHYTAGVLIFLLFDINDIFLELWKVNTSLQDRANGQYRKLHSSLAVVFFVLFFCTWTISRLVWFPQLVLYGVCATLHDQYALADMPPYLSVTFIMLAILYAMVAYWWTFFPIGVYKFAVGQLKNVEDTREYADIDCMEELKKQ